MPFFTPKHEKYWSNWSAPMRLVLLNVVHIFFILHKLYDLLSIQQAPIWVSVLVFCSIDKQIHQLLPKITFHIKLGERRSHQVTKHRWTYFNQLEKWMMEGMYLSYSGSRILKVGLCLTDKNHVKDHWHASNQTKRRIKNYQKKKKCARLNNRWSKKSLPNENKVEVYLCNISHGIHDMVWSGKW